MDSVESLTALLLGESMKHYYQAELETSVERFRATMAAFRGPIDTGIRLDRKGRTLLIVRGERPEYVGRR